MKYICQFVPNHDREKYVSEMRKQIPELQVVTDVTQGYEGIYHSSMLTFLASLNGCGGRDHVHLEDDVILCYNFKQRIEQEIAKHPHDLIQFFTLRQNDYNRGSRYVNGDQFAWNQCLYIPHEIAMGIIDYFPEWYATGRNAIARPTGLDVLVKDYLIRKRLQYWVVVPCLVQHAEETSALNPRSSIKRVSRCFIDDIQVKYRATE
jgi:hypothetical protein